MNAKEYLAERARLSKQKDLAIKYGDKVLEENLTKRISELKNDNTLVVESLAVISEEANKRLTTLNENKDKIKGFLQRLADDLSVYPSDREDSNSKTDNLDKIVPSAMKGAPIYLWIGDSLIAILTFSRDSSSVKAVFDDESDKTLIRAYKLAKDEFFEEIDEVSKLSKVKFNASFSDAKNYEKASDFTAALEKMFGASAFQSNEDGSRSFMVDETSMKRLEAFMKREGLEISKEDSGVVATPNLEKSTDDEESFEAAEDTFDPEFASQLESVWKKHFKLGGVFIRKASLGSDMFFLTCLLIGDKKDQISQIFDNDPIFHSFSFEDIGDDKILFERQRYQFLVKPEEGSRDAFGRVKIAFRKSKGERSKVVSAFDKYVAKVKKAVDDNKEGINSRDQFPDKYFESSNEDNSKTSITESATRIIKGAELKTAVDDTLKAGFKITPASNKGNNGGPIDDSGKILGTLISLLKKEGNFVMSISKGSGTSGQVEFRTMKQGGVGFDYFGKDQFKKDGDNSLDSIWNKAGQLKSDIDKAANESMLEDFDSEKKKQDDLQAVVDSTSAALKKFPSGNMGLTPDDVKASKEYKTAKANFDKAFKALREFNKTFVKKYKKELAADRKARRSSSVSESMSEEMTKPEAIALAKKALKASPDQKDALMKILKNVGYSIKQVDGRGTLVKGDQEVTLEAIAEAKSALNESEESRTD